jgi:hypothetical protein
MFEYGKLKTVQVTVKASGERGRVMEGDEPKQDKIFIYGDVTKKPPF